MVKKQSKKWLLVLLTLALTASGATYLWQKRNSTVTQAPGEWVDGVNYAPPTDEEIQAGEQQKQQSYGQEESQNNPDNTNKQTARVIITDASQYGNIVEVRSFIPDHYADGTCTIVFTKDQLVVTKVTPAYKDISTTICTNPEFNRNEFTSGGQWQVVVSYSSNSATGKSEPRGITIE